MWGFGKGQSVSAPEVAQHASWVPYHSPILADVSRFLNDHRGAFVLDLGTMRTSNVTFYARFAAKVFVEDLGSEITRTSEVGGAPEETPEEAPQKPASPLQNFVEGNARGSYDLFMCWDVFNYLPTDMAASLAADIVRISGPCSMVHLLTWNSSTMPEKAIPFDVLEGDNIFYEHLDLPRIPSPRYTKSRIGKLFPGFERVRSFLSRTGLEEHVLIRRS